MGKVSSKPVNRRGLIRHRINVCDRPENYETLEREIKGKSYPIRLLLTSTTGTPGINVLRDGHGVSRTADWIMYAVEAQFMDKVVAEYGPCKCIRARDCLSRD